jgi:hypothetical protein
VAVQKAFLNSVIAGVFPSSRIVTTSNLQG